MHTDVGGAGGVEVVDRYYVLVIVRTSHWLVWQVVGVGYGIEVERSGGIVGSRDCDSDLQGYNVDDRGEPSSAASIIVDLGIREGIAWHTEEAVKPECRYGKSSRFGVDYSCSVYHFEDVVWTCADCSIRWRTTAWVR